MGTGLRFFGCRGERGLPAWTRSAPPRILHWLAQKRRDAGFYDQRTLALFRRAWVRGNRPSSLLAYVRFRRDLGRLPSRRQVALLMQITANFSRRQKRQLGDLLMESRGLPLDSSLQGPLSPTHIVVRDEQESWRAEFRQWLQARCQQGLCVVGNGGTLLGAGLGRWIDSHGVVVRFNRFQGAASTAVDIGHRLDVWVTSADQDIAVPPGVPWIVVSGPDMAFRLQNWGRFADSLSSGSKVLTVPLSPWRELVAELQAPPSAGLLFLAWSRSLMGGWTTLQAVGFAGVRAGARPYHHANIRHRPGARHHWSAELLVLRRWQEEGLHIELPA